MITLTPRGADVTFDAAGVPLHAFAALGEAEIARLQVQSGNRRVALGELLHVRGERTDRILVEGATPAMHGLGTGLRHGELVIEGDTGDRTGAGLAGGSIHVRGHVGHAAGLSMGGGTLLVDGRAGDHFCAAAPGARRGMTGGEAVVRGGTGRGSAVRLRRGLVVVGGPAGPELARDILAGTVVTLGPVDGTPGEASRRGSIVALDTIRIPRTYRYACAFEPVWVRVLLRHLIRRFAVPVRPEALDGPYRRYCGDVGSPGKGELLVQGLA